MREIPMLFSAPMVRAILEGRKTMTRRVVKPQPALNGKWMEWSHKGVLITEQNVAWHPFAEGFPRALASPGLGYLCPYGQPGDRLWVREAFALQSCVEGEDPPFEDGRPVLRRPEDDVEGRHPLWVQSHYRATDPAPDLCCDRANCAQCRDHDMGPHWRSPVHMPRWASRITLEITGVRVEQLQSITIHDAVQEGYPIDRSTVDGREPFLWFQGLWCGINGRVSWNSNPWVWVVEFKRLEASHG